MLGFFAAVSPLLQRYEGICDMEKLTHFINFLKGKALEWSTALWQGGNTVSNYKQFLNMFQRVFDHTPDGKEVSERLLTLRQGPRRAAEYALKFRTLAAESGWNDSALRTVYRQGLNSNQLREMACRDDESTLDSLI